MAPAEVRALTLGEYHAFVRYQVEWVERANKGEQWEVTHGR